VISIGPAQFIRPFVMNQRSLKEHPSPHFEKYGEERFKGMYNHNLTFVS